MNQQIKLLLENQAFGVCSKIGLRLGIPTKVIRKYFIYASFLTIGSPVLFYLVLAFFIDFKKAIRKPEKGDLGRLL